MHIALPPHGRPRRLTAIGRSTSLLGVLARLRACLGWLDGTGALLANAALVPQFPLLPSPRRVL